LGTTEKGIKQELESTWQSTDICRKRSLVPLAATAKLGVVLMAEWFGGGNFAGLPNTTQLLRSQKLCAAIAPFLTNLVEEEHRAAGEVCNDEPTPDCWESPLTTNVIDPLSNTDFSCLLCHQELWNYYYQCKGCWDLLNQEFNICWECCQAQKYLGLKDPREQLKYLTTSTNEAHFGRLPASQTAKKCGICQKKPTAYCEACKQCYMHRCHCHSEWKLHYRFYTPEAVDDIHANCCLLSVSTPKPNS
jgi:hypothetical protein